MSTFRAPWLAAACCLGWGCSAADEPATERAALTDSGQGKGSAAAGGASVSGAVPSHSLLQSLMSARIHQLSQAITRLDVDEARELSDGLEASALSIPNAHRLAVERARLSLYVGDCDAAQAIAELIPPEDERGHALLRVARSCAEAVAGARVVEDEARGIWLRLQDSSDEVLVPYLFDVAERARAAVRRELGVELPRPLRIDLVRDLFSLSAVSGLSLEAAETTGTVAVARWGRVTLLSPQAASHGYPWEDTVAHELVHLALARATSDVAPLWLQEGVAKRQEVKWRPTRPFDDAPAHDRLARSALLEGFSVGLDGLGNSIAMLPSARAAAVAFAEVTSFIDYWIERNGHAAFRLLLADLEGIGERDADAALRSVSGYTLEQWERLWQQHLRSLPDSEGEKKEELISDARRQANRQQRLGRLLLQGQHFSSAERLFEEALEAAPGRPSLRYQLATARLGMGDEEQARVALGSQDGIDAAHAGWFALRGRLLPDAGYPEPIRSDFRMASALDPWSEAAACEGQERASLGASPRPLGVPGDPRKRALCLAARARPTGR